MVRYHSLAVCEESLPECLEAVAWTCGDHHAVDLLDSPSTQVAGWPSWEWARQKEWLPSGFNRLAPECLCKTTSKNTMVVI